MARATSKSSGSPFMLLHEVRAKAAEQEGIEEVYSIFAHAPQWRETHPKTARAISVLVRPHLILRTDGSGVRLDGAFPLDSDILLEEHLERRQAGGQEAKIALESLRRLVHLPEQAVA